MNSPKLDLTKLTYGQLAVLVDNISLEVKRRNPLFVNRYIPIFTTATAALLDLHDMKTNSATSEEA